MQILHAVVMFTVYRKVNLPWPRSTPNREHSSTTHGPIEWQQIQLGKKRGKKTCPREFFLSLVLLQGCVDKQWCSFENRKPDSAGQKWMWWSWVRRSYSVTGGMSVQLWQCEGRAGATDRHTLIANHIGVFFLQYNFQIKAINGELIYSLLQWKYNFSNTSDLL